jgi:sugar lactone lactonase YvrE
MVNSTVLVDDGNLCGLSPLWDVQRNQLYWVGGPDLTDVFITSAGKSEPMPVMPPNYDPIGGVFGGALYHLNLGIAGRPEYQASIRSREVA